MKRIFTTLFAISISLTAFAQSELVGTWSFQEQESISGKLYINGSPKSVKITAAGNNLSFEKVTAGPDGQDYKVAEIVSLDGKPLEVITASKRKKVITLKKDGNSYSEASILYNAADTSKIDHKTTDTWSVVNGQLILDRKDENMVNGEVWESKATYSKQ